MTTYINRMLICALALCVLSSAALAQSVQIRLQDGSRWRGEIDDAVSMRIKESSVPRQLQGRLVKVEDLYVVLEVELAGELRRKTIFRADILSMESLNDSDIAAPKAASTTVKTRAAKTETAGDVPTDDAGRELGVFVLPLDGGVGDRIRYQEIEAIGKEADKYGRGQIIVLVINTNGGAVVETELIGETIAEIKKRHRVIAWIRKAISAGCWIAMCCDEIYFMTEGTAGSVTTVSGTRSLPEEMVRDHVEGLARLAEENGYSEHIGRAMKFNHYMCSYDKDPETGEVTFYGDLSGEYVLSDDESNLCFNSSDALHCGFSKGTADTEEELGKMLDLPKWHEVSDYGRKIAADWQSTVDRAEDQIRRLIVRRDYYRAYDEPEERIGALIQIYKELLRWWDRAPNVARTMLPEKIEIERQIELLRKELADMKRRQ